MRKRFEPTSQEKEQLLVTDQIVHNAVDESREEFVDGYLTAWGKVDPATEALRISHPDYRPRRTRTAAYRSGVRAALRERRQTGESPYLPTAGREPHARESHKAAGHPRKANAPPSDDDPSEPPEGPALRGESTRVEPSFRRIGDLQHVSGPLARILERLLAEQVRP